MSNKEFYRLMGYWYAKIHAPRFTTTTRRASKSKATGTGQIVKTSRIIPQVNMEKLFINETVHHRMIADAP